MSKSIRFQNLFLEVIIIGFVFFIPLIIFPWAYDYTLIKLNLAQALVLMGLLWRQIKGEHTPSEKTLAGYKHCYNFKLFLIFVFVYLIICFVFAVTSPCKYISLNEFYRIVSYLCVMFLAFISVNIQNIKKIIAAWLFSSVLVAGYAFYQGLGHHLVTAGFGNSNLVAAYLVLVLPIAVCRFFYSFYLGRQEIKKNIWQALPQIAIVIIILAGLWAANSQGAWLGAAVSALMLVVLAGVHDRKKFFLFLGIVVVCVIFFCLIFGPAMIEQVSKDVRPVIWKGAFNMIKDSPVKGHGLGVFFAVYPRYRDRGYFIQQSQADVTTNAHCEYLEMVSETGIIGFVSFLGIMILFFRMVFKFLSQNAGTYSGFTLAGISSGLAGFLAHNTVGVSMRFPSCALLFWFSLGMGVGLMAKAGDCEELEVFKNKNKEKDTGRHPRGTYIVLGLIILFTFILSHSIKTDIIAQIYFKKGVEYKNQDEWEKAVICYKKAIVFAPYFISSYYRLAYVYAGIGDIDEAIFTYEKILSMVPYYARTQANLGTLYLKKPDKQKALFYLKQAEEINPYDVDVLMPMALTYLEQGQKTRAVDYLKRILSLAPEHKLACRILEDMAAQ